MRVTAMPLIGRVKEDRLDSLLGCHALFERKVVKAADAKGFDKAIGDAIKELMLADRAAALDGSMTFVVRIEV